MSDEFKITSIRFREKKGKTREHCEVALDGKTWTKLDAEIVVREGLKIGATLSASRQQELLDEDEVLRARRMAASRSAMKRRSRADLASYLSARGFRDSIIERVLDDLERSGTVNDDAVAERWVRKRRREGGYGAARLKSELFGLGLTEPTVHRSLAAVLKESDPLSDCREFAAKKIRQYQPLDDPKNRRRLADLLRRRGFDGETIESCLRTLRTDQSSQSESR